MSFGAIVGFGKAVRYLLGLLPISGVYSVLRAAVLTYRDHASDYVTLILRPKSASDFKLVAPSVVLGGKRLAVVMQGPVLRDNDFTIETLRMYRQSTDIDLLILSTWEGESEEVLDLAREAGAHVVLCSKPSEPGVWNVNLQVASTMGGILTAKVAGCTHVLKTRTDQRLYRPNFASSLLALIEAFPSSSSTGLNSRLAVSGMNSFVYRPYSISDMLMFGEISDMVRFWDLPLHSSQNNLARNNKKLMTLRELMMRGFPEMLLMENLEKSCGRGFLEMSLEHYHDLVQTKFLVFDPEMVEQVWAKNLSECEYPMRRYRSTDVYENWTFSRWLSLISYRDLGAKVRCDLDRTMTDGDVVS